MTEQEKTPLLISLQEIERQTGWSRRRIKEYAAREFDPLPLLYMQGTNRGGIAITSELTAWLKRNAEAYERG